MFTCKTMQSDPHSPNGGGPVKKVVLRLLVIDVIYYSFDPPKRDCCIYSTVYRPTFAVVGELRLSRALCSLIGLVRTRQLTLRRFVI